MAGIQVTIDGLDEWRELVDPARFVKEMDTAVQRATEMLRDRVKTMPPVGKKSTGYGPHGVPVDFGTLRNSHQKRRLGLMAAEVYVAPPAAGYADAVYEGARGVPPRPWLKWLWEEFDGQEETETIMQFYIDRVLNP